MLAVIVLCMDISALLCLTRQAFEHTSVQWADWILLLTSVWFEVFYILDLREIERTVDKDEDDEEDSSEV